MGPGKPTDPVVQSKKEDRTKASLTDRRKIIVKVY